MNLKWSLWNASRITWWRRQMETFSALLAICAGSSPTTGDVPAQRSVTRSFAVFFDMRLNTRLSKQWWGWWFETPSWPLWRHHETGKSYAGIHIIAQVYRLSAVHCQMTRYSQGVPGYLTRYSVSANEISFDKKISQSNCVFQIRLGLEENDSPLHLVTSTGFLKA